MKASPATKQHVFGDLSKLTKKVGQSFITWN